MVSVTCTAQNQDKNINKEDTRFESGLQIRRTFNSGEKYNMFPPLKNINKNLRIVPDPILLRPFLSRVITWTTGAGRYTSLHQTNFPSGTIAQNSLALQAFQIASLYRAKACFKISLTGTIAHQGLLLVAVRPLTTNSLSGPFVLNSLLTGPHAFLSANEATSVCLEIPFMSSSQLLPTQINGASVCTFKSDNSNYSGADYAELVVYVLNPLTVGVGTATSVSLVIETEFKELEMYVPRNNTITWTAQAAKCLMPCVSACVGRCLYDNCFQAQSSSYGKIATGVFDGIANGAKSTTVDIIDALRSSLRFYTGLHNPNDPTMSDKMIMSSKNSANLVDSTSRFQKLDPYTQFDRIITDYRFLTQEDEMLTNNIIQKPQYVGTFTVTTTDVSGKLLFSRPISPNQGYAGIKTASPVGSTVTVCNNIEHLYNSTRSWSGSLKIYIQSVMTAKHSVKLQVSKYYVPALNAVSATGTPDMYSLSGNLTELLEFSQGGQIAVVDLPFCSQLRSLYNTKDLTANALQHGLYYIHLAQPLVIGDAVPTTAEFNVYIACGDDFTFYGYATDHFLSGGVTLRSEQDLPVSHHTEYRHFGESTDIATIFKKHFPHVSFSKFQALNKQYFKKVDKDTTSMLPVNKGDIVYGSYTSKIRNMKEWPVIKDLSDFKDTFGIEFPQRYRLLNVWPALNEFRSDNFSSVFREKFSISLDSIAELRSITTLSQFNQWYNNNKDKDVASVQFKLFYNQIKKDCNPFDHDMFDKSTKFYAQSAEVMNTPSSQEILTDSSKPAKVDDSTFSDLLKPLVSIRDLVRRITPSSPSLYWTNSAGGAYSDKTIIIPIGVPTPAVGSVNNVTALMGLMYYGSDSGRKFKLIVAGCNSGSVAYNPPGVAFNNNNLVGTSAFASIAADQLLFNVLENRTSVPFIDVCDQWVTMVGAHTDEGTSYCVFEGTIPNINPAEYISNPGSSFTYSLTPTAELGEIIFSVPNMFGATTGETGQVRLLTGYTDESRLGFHMYAPVVTLNLKATAPYNLISCANPNTPTSTANIVYTSVPAYAYFSTLNTTYN